MNKLFKGLALLVAVTCVVWVAVLWHWQATRRDVVVQDLLVYLGLLPLLLLAFVLGLRWAVGAALARQAQADAARAADPAPGGAAAPSAGAGAGLQAEPHAEPAWPVIGAWVNTPAGDDIAGLLEAARAGHPAPSPDAALHDAHGLPVMCARCRGLDLDTVAQGWPGGLSGAGRDTGQAQPAPAVSRALAALRPVLEDAAEAIDAWHQALPEDRRGRARVQVLARWPQDWTGPARTGAGAWLGRFQEERQATSAHAARWQLIELPACSGPEIWQQADSLLRAQRSPAQDELLLLLACHSDLCDASVAALEREGRLFAAGRQAHGLMPGEGAAAVLLAPPEAAGPVGASDTTRAFAPATTAWLHRPVSVRRAGSVDAPGKVCAQALRQAVSQAAGRAGVPLDALARLCSDADRHTPRATELFATTVDQLPQLDAVEDMRLLGVVAGHARHTGALWAVAGAVRQALDTGQPALALSLADAHWRLAAVVRGGAPDRASVSADAAAPSDLRS